MDIVEAPDDDLVVAHCRFRDLPVIEASCTSDEHVPTATSVEQRAVEKNCLKLYEEFEKFYESEDDEVKGVGSPSKHMHFSLQRDKTSRFLQRGLEQLSESYECLDASRPWLVYWILHALELLGKTVEGDQRKQIISFLASCQNPTGGFGGGPGQISHLAPTYAAVNALVILGGEEAYQVINRQRMAEWLDRLRLENGSFVMHEDGEVDIRGVYCALSAARLANVYTPDLFNKTAQWVLLCQTYEGGFGGVPGMEAHGGYSFCGLAALMLLDKGHLCNLDTLLRWAANRQMRLEGGFQGRTNKLVDGCYSFWQGGIFPLINQLLDKDGPVPSRWMFDTSALQEYLLICCQDIRGGLVDKPGKSRDYYHTCYTLSGLSVAQHLTTDLQAVLGDPNNLLAPTHSLYNVGVATAEAAEQYFNCQPTPAPPFEVNATKA